MISEVLDTVEECRSQSMALSTGNDMIVPVITRSLELMQTALQDNSDQNHMLRAIASLKNECNLSRQFDASMDAPRDLMYRFFQTIPDFMNVLTTTGRLPISQGDQLAIEGAAATDPIITHPLDRITFDQTGVVPMPTNPTSVDQTGTVPIPHDPAMVYQSGGGIPFPIAHTTGYQPGAVPFNLAPTSSDQAQRKRCQAIAEKVDESIMVLDDMKGTSRGPREVDAKIRNIKQEIVESDIEDEENENSILVVDRSDVTGDEEGMPELSSILADERTQEIRRNVQIGNDDNVGTVGVERRQTRGRKIITAKSVSREAEKDDRDEENVVADMSEEEEEKMVEKPQGAMKCRRCSEFATNIVSSFVAHLKLKHSTTLTKEGLVFRCECGHECRSASHANSGTCRNKKVVLIGDNDDDELEAEEVDENMEEDEERVDNMEEDEERVHNMEDDEERVSNTADKANTSGNEDQFDNNVMVRPHRKRTAVKIFSPSKKPRVYAPQVMSTQENGALKSMKSIKREREEERESKKINNFECTSCQFTSGSVAYYRIHLRKSHNSTMKQSEIYFRCECGHKYRCGEHSKVCQKVSLIVKESDEPYKAPYTGPFVDVDED